MNDTVAIVGEEWFDSTSKFDRFVDDMFKGLSQLSDQGQMKSRLRAKIAETLAGSFAIPELIDGLTEYLWEIISQDSRQKLLFENS